jgi:hypothetical protein
MDVGVVGVSLEKRPQTSRTAFQFRSIGHGEIPA